MSEKKPTIVVALGGNAILADDASAKGQKERLKQTVEYLIPLIQKDVHLIITHGNGPQVGNLVLQQQASDSSKNPAMPLDTCVAMTQGSIGYWLQNELRIQLKEAQMAKPVVTVVTEITVDAQDPAFAHPTIPIGPFLTETAAKEAMAATDAIYREDAGRGWRKVVASPAPQAIQEVASIKALIEQNTIVICAGGGGIPVLDNGLGVEAVIDKDFASEKLARLVDADQLIILTGVEKIALNFGKENEQWLDHVTAAELETYVDEGHFSPGSMLPKVQAALNFVKMGTEKRAVITSLDKLAEIEDAGTQITWK